ncbi:MAG: hypothetical protein K2M44_01625 [Clostridia bacterium]|nr:hypothetical protein [Clostridia bacterium]
MVFYIIIGVFVAWFVILSIVSLVKRLRSDIIAAVSQSDMEWNIKNLAVNMSAVENTGFGVGAYRLLFKLRRAFKVVCRKVKEGAALLECEKWIYENYNSLAVSVNARQLNRLNMLPHSHGEVRVAALAKMITQLNKCDIDYKSIADSIRHFNKYTPLFNEEIYSLPIAFRYALIFNVVSVCDKIIAFDKSRRRAQSDTQIDSRYYKSPGYLYYYKQSGKPVSDGLILKRCNIGVDDIDINFTSLVVDLNVILSSCIKSYKKLDNILSESNLINLSPIDAVMSKDRVYAQMDIKSKRLYSDAVAKLSTRYNVTEKAIIDNAFMIARCHNLHFGEVIFDMSKQIGYAVKGKTTKAVRDKSAGINSGLYISLIVVSDLILSALVALLMPNWRLSIGIGIITAIASLKICEYFVGKIIGSFIPIRSVPRMNYKNIPKEGYTVVAVSEVFGCAQDVHEAMRRVVAMRNCNKDDNIGYILLADYKVAAHKRVAEDEDIIKACKSYGDSDICIMLRSRVGCGKIYRGRERKRGAIHDMNEYLINGDSDKFDLITFKVDKPNFVMLLDSDSEVGVGGVKSAINAMLHPLADKYDLLTFGCSYRLSSIKTLYSRKFLYSSGTESYCSYSDFYYNLCGKSIYCGKGIYRLDRYEEKLSGKLPDGKILSHDIIEGAILNTGALNQSVYEDAPLTFLSDTKRQERWMRGDLLLAPYIAGKQMIDGIYSYTITSNIISLLRPIAMLALFILALVFPSINILLPIVVLALAKPLMEIGFFLFSLQDGVRLRYVIAHIGYVILGCMSDILLTPYRALLSLKVCLFTAVKAMLKRDLLQWNTFRSGQKHMGGAALKHVAEILSAVVVMTALSVALIGYIGVAIYSLSFAVYAAALYLGAIKIGKRTRISEGDREFLDNCARATYKYFEDMRAANKLVCDNYQFEPMQGCNQMTSPTNLGMGLLSHVCAAKLGYIDDDTACELIMSDIAALHKLPKWKGHLYNWYDVKDCSIKQPRFVSGVDSGNFLACCICVASYLDSQGRHSSQLDELIFGCDLDAVFDASIGQFYIGYNCDTDKYEGHYDMLASEARTLAYIGACLSSDTAAWNNLGRRIVNTYGNMLISWGGTAFEYLMPQLFFPAVDKSMITLTCKRAVKVMRHNKCGGLFGISESGYYEFNDTMSYKYSQFGISSLALKADADRCIIAPYASALALEFAPKKAVANLNKIVSVGAFGEYGFCEAIDYTAGGEIVKSYMSHHQGMILAAVTNALEDNCIQKLFAESPITAGGRLMLEERMPEQRNIAKPKADFIYKERSQDGYVRYIDKLQSFPAINVMAGGLVSTVIDDAGCGYSVYRHRNIGIKSDSLRNNAGAFIYIKDGDKVYSPTFAPLRDDKEKYKVVFTPSYSQFENEADKCSLRVSVVANLCAEVRILEIENVSDKSKEIDVAYYEKLSMAYDDEYKSHPAFNDMFISTAIEGNKIFATKRSREKLGDWHTCLSVNGLNSIIAVTDIRAFLGRLGDESKPKIFSSNISQSIVGEVLNPCLGAKGKVVIAAGESRKIWFCRLSGDDIGKLKENAERSCAYGFDEYAVACSKTLHSSPAGRYLFNREVCELVADMAARLIYQPFNAKEINNMSLLNSGDGVEYNAKAIVYDYDANPDKADTVISAALYLNLGGVACNLYILLEDEDSYYRPRYNKVFKKTRAGDITAFNFIIAVDKKDEDKVKKVKQTAFIIYDDYKISQPAIRGAEPTCIKEGKLKPCLLPKQYLASGKGYFIEEGDYIQTSVSGLPYSNVICMQHGGFVITDNGGGFTYFGNSNEHKLTAWYNDQIKDTASERLFILTGGSYTRINKLNEGGYVRHGIGYTRFVSCVEDVNCEVSVYPVCDGLAKVYEIELNNVGDNNKVVESVLDCDAALGRWREGSYLIAEIISPQVLRVKSGKTKKELYIKCLGTGRAVTDAAVLSDRLSSCDHIYRQATSYFNNPACAMTQEVYLGVGEKKSVYFVLTADQRICYEIKEEDISRLKGLSRKYFLSLSPISIKSGEAELDMLLNNWLMYQVVSSRMNGRCGFYQAGGAIGFRDQLQDCLSVIYTDRKRVSELLLESAAHQYEEGDVMHWWHPPAFGVRTRISDDKLFLGYVAAQYVKHTGDKGILSRQVRYLTSSPLQVMQESRLEHGKYGEKKEDVLSHILRGIDSALKYGKHGLLLIGCGDWNDALNGIGAEGKGESVWLSMFAYRVISDILPLMDADKRIKYIEEKDRLKAGIDAAFTGDRFMRAYTDDDVALGAGADGEPCALDILAQSWAVLSGAAESKHADIAIDSALSLVDYKHGIIALLSPPFTKDRYCGYISSYPRGVRENGGQYTHAAIWLFKAVCELGREDEAYRLMRILNPIVRCESEEDELYMAEPYVLPADIYTNPQHYARAGWSWYTGSAAWYYKTLLEDYLGFRVVDNTIVCSHPLYKNWRGMVIRYRYKDCVYEINYAQGDKDAIIEDGVTMSAGGISLERKAGVYKIIAMFK